MIYIQNLLTVHSEKSTTIGFHSNDIIIIFSFENKTIQCNIIIENNNKNNKQKIDYMTIKLVVNLSNLLLVFKTFK